MNPSEISVRQWQENYRAGAYVSKDVEAQRSAGWWRWHCRDDALAGRLKKAAPLVLGIKAPFILDNYTVWFTNERGGHGLIYDSVRFEMLSGPRDKNFFMVDLNNPRELIKWTLFTKRFGLYTAEYGCGHVRDMVQYINTMAQELEMGIRPAFLDERAAVETYVLSRAAYRSPRALRREGESSYSFLDMDDGRRKMVHVARSLEDGPPGFLADQAVPVNGMFVYCLEDAEAEKNQKAPVKGKNHSKKKNKEGNER